MEEKDILKAINQKFKDLALRGISIKALPPIGKLHSLDRKAVEIDLSKVGAGLDAIFKVMKVQISVGHDKLGAAISLQYDWKFWNGGQNGHRARHIYSYSKKKWDMG
jgi:hypothetical protein